MIKRIFYNFYITISIIIVTGINSYGSISPYDCLVDMPLLIVSPDARGSSLAECVSGESDGIESLYWNPAGLAYIDKKEIFFTYKKSMDIMNYVYLSYGMPASKKKKGSIGVDVSYMGGPNLGNFGRIYFISLSTGYGYSFNKLKIGTLVKYVYSNIFKSKNNGIAFDLGMQFEFNKRIKAGISVKNLGFIFNKEDSMFKFPIIIIAGASFDFHIKGSKLSLITAAEVVMEYYYPGIGFGLEYSLKDFLFVRTGYKLITDVKGESKELLKGFGFGFGTMIKIVKFDICISPFKLKNFIEISTKFFF